MGILGIACEYNPFHNGHKFHIEESKKASSADAVLCVMSGDFTQRGEVACMDKWIRAEWAVKNGADLVLEIPSIFATSNAGDFAKGGIAILEKAGCDFVSFGAESEGKDLMQLNDFVQNNSDAINEGIDEAIKKGISYPAAREQIVLELAKDKGLANKFKEILHNRPNNILALEYLSHIRGAKPIIIKRVGTGYKEDKVNGLPSATAIRTMAKSGENYRQFVPKEVCQLNIVDKQKLYEQIVSKVLNVTEEQIDNVYSADDGFGSKLKKQIRTCSSYDEIVNLMVSKRHTKTRIQRFLIQLLLNITREDLKQKGYYARALAFNDKGAKILKEIANRHDDNFPVITNIGKNYKNLYQGNIANSLDVDIRSSDYYNVLTECDLYSNSDFVKKPKIIK